MTDDTVANNCSPSTTQAWKWVRIPAPAEGPGDSATQEHLRRLNRAKWRRPITLTVSYRGGPECWWEIDARGRTWRFPGSLALHDVLVVIYDGRGGKPRRSSGRSG
jgi:hypothetical protein